MLLSCEQGKGKPLRQDLRKRGVKGGCWALKHFSFSFVKLLYRERERIRKKRERERERERERGKARRLLKALEGMYQGRRFK